MSTYNNSHLYPPHILKLLALFHRLPQSHQRFQHIEKQVRNELSGFYGETRLFYPLSKLHIFHKVLPNTRLFLHPTYFQIDFLIITPKFILILESKYYSDVLMFDDTAHQVIQKKDQQIKVFEDPVLQAEEQAYQLTLWLEKHGYNNLPIEYYVVMTNPQTRLGIDPSNSHHAEKIVSLQRLPSLFRKLVDKHPQNVLNRDEINNLTNTITQNHQTYSPDILKKYNVAENELLKGVFCMRCGKLGMKMTNRLWQCFSCGNRVRAAHENTLKDYYLLVGPHITNQEFRNFANLAARNTARDMLIRSSTNRLGTTNTLKYHLSYNLNSDAFNYLSELNVLRKK